MKRDIGAVIFDQEHASLFFADYSGNLGEVASKCFSEIYIKCKAEGDPTRTSPEDKHTYAVWLSSAMPGTERYEIQQNVDPQTGEILEGISKWRCLYNHIAANTVFVSILGYGDTPSEALTDCIIVKQHMIDTYNSEGERV